MASMLRGNRRSYNLDLQRKNHKRKLVIAALEKRRKEQTKDKLLMDIIAAVPRSTEAHIESVIKKVRNENEHDAVKLEDALAHCRNLSYNLTGAKPTDLWSDSARVVWLDAIEAVTKQSSRWKACPLVLIHPYCGTVEVVISLCGKHQALSEFSRMRLFADELREGLDDILDDIHPIKDDESGHALPFEETKEILLDLSNNDGHLSEDDGVSEDDSTAEFNDEVNKVTKDWTLDKVQTEGEPVAKSRLISPLDINMPSPPNATVNLTSTPPPTMNQSRSSSASSFGSPLFGMEPPRSPKPSPKSSPKPSKLPVVKSPTSTPPPPKIVSGHEMSMQVAQKQLNKMSSNRASTSVNRSLFPNDRQVTLLYKPSPWQIESVPEEEADATPLSTSPPPSPKKSPKVTSDLATASEIYPNGFTVLPVKNRRKSDAKKQKDKKRPVSSPNLPATKQSRMDRTEVAIEQLQLGQANQNAMLQQLADQMSQFNLHLQLQNSMKK